MYQERNKTQKKKAHYSKSFVLLVSMLTLILGILGATVAYLVTQTRSVENKFTYGEVEGTVEETFEAGVKEHVTIKNTGDVEAYIRAKVIVTWKDSKGGNVYGQLPVIGEDYQIEYGSEWVAKGGYYYYASPVSAGNSTLDLIVKCIKLPGASQPEGYNLSVEIISESIQSKPTDAVKEAWGFVPGTGN